MRNLPYYCLLLYFFPVLLTAQPVCIPTSCCCGTWLEIGIPNGNFEALPHPPLAGRITYSAGESFSGFTVLENSIDLLGPGYPPNGTSWASGNPNGASNYIDLNGYEPGILTTTLTGLSPGEDYTIVLWYAKNPGASQVTCHLLLAGGAWLDETWNATNNGADGWLQKCIAFTAQASSAELKFIGSSDFTTAGMLLDDLSLWKFQPSLPVPVFLTNTTCNPALVGLDTFVTVQGNCSTVTITTTSLGTPDTIFLSRSTCDSTQAGIFIQHLTNQSGCDSTVITSINFVPDGLQLAFDLSYRDCLTRPKAELTLNASGGTAPFEYSMDGQNFQNSNMFSGVSTGAHHVIVRDAKGCTYADSLTVVAPAPVLVNLGDDLHVALGDEVLLQGNINIPLSSLDLVTWPPPVNVSCADCLTQPVTPLQTADYIVGVVAENGCQDADTLRIYVDRRKYVYVPNVFSPNGDGLNDIFSLFVRPGSVRSVLSFLIFDRWGELVYQQMDFQPDDPLQTGWNGIFRGKKLDPGVFAWIAKIEFLDGSRESYRGDVLLVR